MDGDSIVPREWSIFTVGFSRFTKSAEFSASIGMLGTSYRSRSLLYVWCGGLSKVSFGWYVSAMRRYTRRSSEDYYTRLKLDVAERFILTTSMIMLYKRLQDVDSGTYEIICAHTSNKNA